MIEVKCIANMNIRVINNVSIVISGQGISKMSQKPHNEKKI